MKPWGQEKCYWGFISVFENTAKNLIFKFIFPITVAATLLSGSRKGATGA